jgi:hypothetical protein
MAGDAGALPVVFSVTCSAAVEAAISVCSVRIVKVNSLRGFVFPVLLAFLVHSTTSGVKLIVLISLSLVECQSSFVCGREDWSQPFALPSGLDFPAD